MLLHKAVDAAGAAQQEAGVVVALRGAAAEQVAAAEGCRAGAVEHNHNLLLQLHPNPDASFSLFNFFSHYGSAQLARRFSEERSRTG